MKISGRKSIDRTPEELWELLTKVEVLRRCIPGCLALEMTGQFRYRLLIRIGHGLVKGKFHGEVWLENIVEPESCCLDLRAKGIPGSVRGYTNVRLMRLDGERRTEVLYETHARVGGLLRAMGPKLFHDATRSFVDHFFESLTRE